MLTSPRWALQRPIRFCSTTRTLICTCSTTTHAYPSLSLDAGIPSQRNGCDERGWLVVRQTRRSKLGLWVRGGRLAALASHNEGQARSRQTKQKRQRSVQAN